MAIGVAFAALLLIMAIRSAPLHDVWREISAVSLPILSLALLTKFTNLLLAAVRSQVLLRNQHRFGLLTLFDCQLAGFAGNNLIPLRFGDLVRIDYMANRGKLSHGACLQVVVIERLLDTLSLLALFVVLVPFMSTHFERGPGFELASAIAVVGALAMFAVQRWPHLFMALISRLARFGGARLHRFLVPKVERFLTDLTKVSAGTNTVLAFIISLAIWGVSMLSVLIWLWAFGVSLPWYASFLVLIFLAFGLALPATPGQVGTYHYFVAAGLTAAGLDRVHALSIAIVGHAVAVIPFTVIGLPSLVSFGLKRSAATEPSLSQQSQ
jgi:uncharacterized protein (TIRG00374 family)